MRCNLQRNALKLICLGSITQQDGVLKHTDNFVGGNPTDHVILFKSKCGFIGKMNKLTMSLACLKLSPSPNPSSSFTLYLPLPNIGSDHSPLFPPPDLHPIWYSPRSKTLTHLFHLPLPWLASWTLVSLSVGVSVLHVCPKSELLGKLHVQTAERINKTLVVRASVGVSQCLIIFLQETPCQVDCLCAHLLCRRLECRILFRWSVCGCTCICVTRYYKDTCFTKTVVRFTQGGRTKPERGPPYIITPNVKTLI